jgi:hypothetical protein
LQGYCLVHSLDSFNLTCNDASLNYKSQQYRNNAIFCLPKKPFSSTILLALFLKNTICTKIVVFFFTENRHKIYNIFFFFFRSATLFSIRMYIVCSLHCHYRHHQKVEHVFSFTFLFAFISMWKNKSHQNWKNGTVARLHKFKDNTHTTLIAFLLWKLLTFHHSINTARTSMFVALEWYKNGICTIKYTQYWTFYVYIKVMKKE